jgi:hypothetical protein
MDRAFGALRPFFLPPYKDPAAVMGDGNRKTTLHF